MSSVDLKTSLLVNRQVPEFVRDEYPTFVTFLEAYYQFLEGTANTGTTANTLVTTAKSLRDIRDVDSSLEDFQTNFFNTYASLIPLGVQADKALLFKHLVPLYKAKGSDASFKLLFQLIFGVDIDVILPQNNVLKSSSSKWQIDNKLRINQDIASVYTGDGTTKTFTLAQIVGKDEITVYVNNVEQTNFFVDKEYRKLNLVTAPANNTIVRVVYDSFDTTLLNNRKVIGIKSGASAIIEQANRRIISDTLNLGLPVELLINTESLDGSFLNGEFVTIPIINPDDPYGNTINIEVSTFSIVKQFNIIDGGFNYQVGDPVIVTSGNASVNAIGTVSSIFKGLIESVAVSSGGSVFANLSPVAVSGNGAVTLTVVVDGIDQSGTNAANSFIVSTDIVSPYGSTVLSSANYAFANSIAVTSPNLNTRIVDVIGFQTLSVGPITNVKVLLTSGASLTTPLLDAFGAPYGPLAGALRSPKSLRSIGRIKVNGRGSNYVVGDEVVFGVNPPGTYGQYAAATVEAVTPTGGIVTIGMANTRLVGTGTVTGSSSSVSGSGTQFLTDLRVGDKIDINNESRIVSTISDDITLSVTSPFTYSASSKKIGVFGRNPKGGHSYTQNNFPSVTVSSVSGVGASIEIDSLVSDGEIILPTGIGQPGQILSIQVLNPGSGYEYIPIVTITGGSGTATANADIERSYLTSPGRWITSDSIISSTERNLAGRDYYVNYSYVISSQIEFYRYKQLLKELLHPVGFVKYATFNKSNTIELTDVSVSTINVATDNQFLTVSGNVSVGNGSVLVTGMGTKFNIAATRNIIVPGTSRIAVNGEIRTVNSIVSNTSLLVSSNVNDIWIVNAGSGYSNGHLLFSNGGGTITSLTITNTGSGYESGNVVLSGADEAIPAIATVVANGTGHLQSVTLVSGGLYSGVPIALPASSPHKVLYANSITITNPGAGYVDGFLNFTGGAPIRPANVSVKVYPSNGAIQSLTINDSGLYESNPTSALPNSSANIVVFGVTATAVGNGHSNGILTFSGGDPTRAASVGVEVYPANGAIRRFTIYDSGLYASAPTAVLNTTPISISTVVSNTAPAFTYGRFVSNGFITFTGGDPIIDANATVEVYPSNGTIRRVTVTNAGLYRTAPTVLPNSTPVSVTQVLPLEGGTGYANGYIVLQGGGANTNADVSIVVNGTGSIVRTVINNIGLYTGNSAIAVQSVNSLVDGLPQVGTGATFSVYVNSNTSNVPVLSTTTATNATYTAAVSITANSNSVTNATFTMSGVSNTQTIAVIDVGFTGTNTGTANTVEVYPSNGAIRRIIVTSPGEYFYRPDVTPNTGGAGAIIRVNSVGTFSQTANGQEMIIWK
jgi:hypothetical protein